MTEAITAEEVNVRHHVYRIMDQHLDQAFEELDNLHKRGIHDDAVIKALRDGGYKSEADAYIEWANCIDPDVQDDNTTTSPDGVTDPAGSPEHEAMQAAADEAAKIEERPQMDPLVVELIESIIKQFEDDGAYMETTDEGHVLVDGTIDIVKLVGIVASTTYASAARDIDALAGRLQDTMRRMVTEGHPGDVTRYSAYSEEARTIALGLNKRALELKKGAEEER